MMQLEDALRHHLQCEQNPVHQTLLCRELVRIGKLGGDVPRSSEQEVMQALEALIRNGEVSRAGERVAIIRDRPASTKATKTRQPKQMGLFD